MADEITPKEVYVMLRGALQKRFDLGFRNTLANRLLEPPNPFEPTSVARPQRWFVLSCVVLLAAVGAILYFNFWN